MKVYKIFIAIMLCFFASCSEDKHDPIGSINNQITITSPTSNTQFTTSPNQASATAFVLKWTPVDFGYSSAVVYTLEIFYDTSTTNMQTIALGSFNENQGVIHEFPITNKILNDKLFAFGVSTSSISNFKMRIKAVPYQQSATATNGLIAYSDYTAFTSNVYNPIYEKSKIYVFGNFGAASTFADWSISTTGASNSPTIYSLNDDGKYEGFVYMNNAAPQFKFALPDDTNLNIKGLGTQFAFTGFLGVDATNFLGTNTPGTLLASTDISTGNVITPFATGSSTYLIRVDWALNKYAISKRVVVLKGSMTSNANVTLTYETNPTSPYYRMYVNTNANLISTGTGTIQFISSGLVAEQRLDVMGYDGPANTLLQTAPNDASTITNKMKMGNNPFKIQASGNYKVVLDLNHCANYNLKFIQN